MVGSVIHRLAALALLLAGCHHTFAMGLPRSSLSARCALVEAILGHKTRPPGEPNTYRVPLMADECVRLAASWRGKVLIKVQLIPNRDNIFASGETCPSFQVYTPSLRAADLPVGLVALDLTPDGPQAFHWEWYVHGIERPSLGTCGPNEGRVLGHDTLWTTADRPQPKEDDIGTDAHAP